mmetsp:Transcript_1593/g.3031  ORF Transcript_1593/g.3031 Transcript_1593/m.3031 type:complete len:134 (-) Transcript_1593:268-669(-)
MCLRSRRGSDTMRPTSTTGYLNNSVKAGEGDVPCVHRSVKSTVKTAIESAIKSAIANIHHCSKHHPRGKSANKCPASIVAIVMMVMSMMLMNYNWIGNHSRLWLKEDDLPTLTSHTGHAWRESDPGSTSRAMY